jgi:RNA polymerase sigma-70 factor (ECF subfamily)
MTGALALAPFGWEALAEACPTVDEQRSTEEALTRAAASGDRGAFARLVDLHKRTVFGLCLRLLQDREEARDAAQETFVRAWGAMATYDSTHPFAPWLLRIARNHCVDQVRRRIPSARRVELDAPLQGDAEPPQLADGEATGADEQLAKAQLTSSLDGAVAALPTNYREVIHLFHVEHMSYKEIAATMEIPIGTVMTWLHRARARLREALQERELR